MADDRNPSRPLTETRKRPHKNTKFTHQQFSCRLPFWSFPASSAQTSVRLSICCGHKSCWHRCGCKVQSCAVCGRRLLAHVVTSDNTFHKKLSNDQVFIPALCWRSYSNCTRRANCASNQRHDSSSSQEWRLTDEVRENKTNVVFGPQLTDGKRNLL